MDLISSFFHCTPWKDKGQLSYPEQEALICLFRSKPCYHVYPIASVMLFAIEGGGFLSSSASGYSSGLALLFGHKNEDKTMKISPWNQYQLVHQESNRALPALARHQIDPGCSYFTCFGCVSPCDDESFPSLNHPESSTESVSDGAGGSIAFSTDENERKVWLKGGLKRPSTSCCVILREDDEAPKPSEELQSNLHSFAGRRRIQWSDTCGKELTEIREFELSDDDMSADEIEQKSARRCECVIQ